MLTGVLIAFAALVLLGVLLGVILAVASIKLAVEVNPLITQIEAALPGANCGACGKPGCAGYAGAIVNENAALDLCKPGAGEVTAAIAKIMGKDHVASGKIEIAFVYCKGGKQAWDRFEYSGTPTCAAAALVSGGQKQCSYGCLGFGDCVVSCKFDAMTMAAEGYPQIDKNKCINCGACIKACPKKIIRQTERKEVRHVICSSLDKGKVAKDACTVSCIACGICVKNCPFEAIALENNLAVIDAEKCTNCGICVTKCPTKAIA